LNDDSNGHGLESLVVGVNFLDFWDPLWEWSHSNYYKKDKRLIFESNSMDDQYTSKDFFLMPMSAPNLLHMQGEGSRNYPFK